MRTHLIATLMAALAASPAMAQSWSDRFVDPQDGKFDMSSHLLEHRGFLPVPLLITEPAVGYGGGAALLFFSESIAESRQRSESAKERFAPPNIGGIAAFKTENGSQGLGGGYFGTLAGDRYRYLLAAGKAELNLDIYGLAGKPRRFALDAPFALAQGLARIGDSDWLVGARYLYAGSSASFAAERPSEIPVRQLESDIGRASLLLDYDSRDNMFTPSSGSYLELDVGMARPGLGSTSSFENVMLRGHSYLPLGKSAVLGLRGDGQFSRGDVPFYALPYIKLRGIPAMRYQGSKVLVAEAELRYNLDARWALVGFAGSGRTDVDNVSFVKAQSASAVGTGFRYLIARKLGLYAGMDVARGPEETAIYLQVGSAWN